MTPKNKGNAMGRSIFHGIFFRLILKNLLEGEKIWNR
jgi:hypothetical protein